MYKQSPSRGLKSKGNKVKRVVQVLVLVTICFWLMYQVRHSEEKRGAFDAKDEKVVNDALMEDEILRFSRKDLPRFTEKIGTGGEKDGEDDGEKEPDDEDEEENKLEKEKNHEDDELEREDRRIEETYEDRGGGDDETDENEHESEHEHEHEHENEQELENEEVDEDKGKEDNEEDEHEVVKIEAGHEHGDEEVDEDKGKEDKDEDVEEENRAENVEKEFHENEERIDADDDDDERKEDRSDLEEVQEVNEGGDQENVDAHETREEQYKADDASSEVAHHVRSIIPKTENVTLDHATDIFGEVETGQESESKSSDNHDEMSSNLTSVDEEHRRVHSATNANSSQNINVENSSTHTSDDEDAGAFQHDPIDTFDVSVAEEEEESRDDMDTLPDIKMEGQAAEEAMA